MRRLVPCIVASALAYSDLPLVSTIVSQTSRSLERFAEQAEAVRKRIEYEQKKTKHQLSEQKDAYSRKLQELVDSNTAMGDANSRLKLHNDALASYSEDLRGRINTAERANSFLIHSLASLDSRFELATQFLSDTMKVTNETDTVELQVLQKSADGSSLQQLLKVARAELMSRKVKLLQHKGTIVVKGSRGPPPLDLPVASTLDSPMSSPRDLVRAMSEGIAKLGYVQEAGEAKLKEDFMALYKEGLRQREDIVMYQDRLKEEAARQEEAADKLEAALNTLEGLHKDLLARVKTVQAFAQKADEAVSIAIQEGSKDVTPMPLDMKHALELWEQSQRTPLGSSMLGGAAAAVSTPRT